MRSIRTSIEGNKVEFLGQTLKLTVFIGLVERHIRTVSGTLALEQKGSELISEQFQDDLLTEFIKSVCRWGGYAGVWARVLRGNELPFVRDRFQTALDLLDSETPDVSGALEEVIRISGLSTSFGSKHLRFLRPSHCPVLDSVIGRGLGYPESSEGYRLHAADCQEVCVALLSNSIENPCRRKVGRWFGADADMALFTYLQGFKAVLNNRSARISMLN